MDIISLYDEKSKRRREKLFKETVVFYVQNNCDNSKLSIIVKLIKLF